MPKKKTHKGLTHRVRVTRNGKVVRFQAGKRKLMAGKGGNRRRRLSRSVVQGGEQAANIRFLLSS